MGMYTGLRGEIHLKEEYIDKIRTVVEEGEEWSDALKDIADEEPRVFEFVHKPRARFIPRGALCCTPCDWGLVGHAYITDEGVLDFTCALKNYDDEIKAFVNMLPVIATSWSLEELYEEYTESTFHKSQQG